LGHPHTLLCVRPINRCFYPRRVLSPPLYKVGGAPTPPQNTECSQIVWPPNPPFLPSVHQRLALKMCEKFVAPIFLEKWEKRWGEPTVSTPMGGGVWKNAPSALSKGELLLKKKVIGPQLLEKFLKPPSEENKSWMKKLFSQKPT